MVSNERTQTFATASQHRVPIRNEQNKLFPTAVSEDRRTTSLNPNLKTASDDIFIEHRVTLGNILENQRQ